MRTGHFGLCLEFSCSKASGTYLSIAYFRQEKRFSYFFSKIKNRKISLGTGFMFYTISVGFCLVGLLYIAFLILDIC